MQFSSSRKATREHQFADAFATRCKNRMNMHQIGLNQTGC
jgi:hypothetical protein